MGFANGNVYEVRVLVEHTGGQQCVNVLHYDGDNHGDPQINSGQSLADFFASNLPSNMTSFFSPAWSVKPFVVSEAKDPLNPLKARSQWVSGIDHPGVRSSGSEELPQQCCALATLRTAHIGKRYRGRIFVPWPLQEPDQAAGVFTSSILTGMAAYLAAIPRVPDVAGPGSLATCTWSVYSRTNRAQSLDPYLNAVTTATLHPEVHVLRSRQSF